MQIYIFNLKRSFCEVVVAGEDARYNYPVTVIP